MHYADLNIRWLRRQLWRNKAKQGNPFRTWHHFSQTLVSSPQSESYREPALNYKYRCLDKINIKTQHNNHWPINRPVLWDFKSFLTFDRRLNANKRLKIKCQQETAPLLLFHLCPAGPTRLTSIYHQKQQIQKLFEQRNKTHSWPQIITWIPSDFSGVARARFL